jgi:hypothetical protein
LFSFVSFHFGSLFCSVEIIFVIVVITKILSFHHNGCDTGGIDVFPFLISFHSFFYPRTVSFKVKKGSLFFLLPTQLVKNEKKKKKITKLKNFEMAKF